MLSDLNCDDAIITALILPDDSNVRHPGILLISIFILNGCSEDNNSQNNDHVWKEQTEAIDKAKAVEGLLMDTAEDQRRQIQDQSE